MQSFMRSTLSSTLQGINTVAENCRVRQASFKNSLAKIIPKKPKKPKTAIDCFLCEIRPQLEAENPNLTLEEMKTISREMWKELGSEAKLPFKKAAKEGVQRHNEEYMLYICSLSDEESAAQLLKNERRRQTVNLRDFRDKLLATGKPRKPGPAFSLFMADIKAQGACDAFSSQQEYYEIVKGKWLALPEERREEYKAKAREKLDLHKGKTSQWEEKVTEHFSKWDDIYAIATNRKTMADFERPVKPSSAFLLFVDDIKFEEYGQTESNLADIMLKWDELEQKEKDEYIATAQKLHDDYKKELDEWNKRMNETMGSWASKILPQRS